MICRSVVIVVRALYAFGVRLSLGFGSGRLRRWRSTGFAFARTSSRVPGMLWTRWPWSRTAGTISSSVPTTSQPHTQPTRSSPLSLIRGLGTVRGCTGKDRLPRTAELAADHRVVAREPRHVADAVFEHLLVGDVRGRFGGGRARQLRAADRRGVHAADERLVDDHDEAQHDGAPFASP